MAVENKTQWERSKTKRRRIKRGKMGRYRLRKCVRASHQCDGIANRRCYAAHVVNPRRQTTSTGDLTAPLEACWWIATSPSTGVWLIAPNNRSRVQDAAATNPSCVSTHRRWWWKAAIAHEPQTLHECWRRRRWLEMECTTDMLDQMGPHKHCKARWLTVSSSDARGSPPPVERRKEMDNIWIFETLK